jgi:hypothetical protein
LGVTGKLIYTENNYPIAITLPPVTVRHFHYAVFLVVLGTTVANEDDFILKLRDRNRKFVKHKNIIDDHDSCIAFGRENAGVSDSNAAKNLNECLFFYHRTSPRSSQKKNPPPNLFGCVT